MKLIHKVLIRFALMLAFLISFAAINFEAANWGLQWGWVFSFIFCVSYLPLVIFRRRDYIIFRDPRFIMIKRLFLIIFTNTLLAWFSIKIGLINLSDSDMLTRSMGHTGYLSFYAVVFVCVYHFLKSNPEVYWNLFRWFFLYPFIFISVWGIYQILATYEIVEYNYTFNNNLSVGFTFERFRGSHRVSSVFPEPSEYSYYLAMMAPIIWAWFRGKLPYGSGPRLRWLLLLLFITQAIFVKSLSFFLALPVIAMVILRAVEGKNGLKSTVQVVVVSAILVAVVGLGLGDRLFETASGEDGSSLTRLNGFLEAVDMFNRSPVIGGGYGIMRGLDAFSFMLACFGVVGTASIIVTLKMFFKEVSRSGTPIFTGAGMCLIAGCIASNPVFDHIFIWIILAFFSACPKGPLVAHPVRINSRFVSISRQTKARVLV